jgi:hypothetical protein
MENTVTKNKYLSFELFNLYSKTTCFKNAICNCNRKIKEKLNDLSQSHDISMLYLELAEYENNLKLIDEAIQAKIKENPNAINEVYLILKKDYYIKNNEFVKK